MHIYITGNTYVDEERRSDTKAAIDAIEHCPPECTSRHMSACAQRINSKSATIMNTPSKEAKASHWAEDGLHL